MQTLLLAALDTDIDMIPALVVGGFRDCDPLNFTRKMRSVVR